eukprot:gb/GECH01001266.1/.p1 GENE.gb/GECH01001266.1/~~gb/GECH01001266.1/.p1  ORF type:complete len:376 (+),score=93.29 gb/GECH01001266.1/:1-1128(+)
MSRFKSDVVVIDIGSDSCKICYSGEDSPQFDIKTILNKPISEQSNISSDSTYVGKPHDTQHYISVEPIQLGKTEDWNELQEYFKHLFLDELEISPKDQKVLLTGSLVYSRENREKIAQIFFENLRVAGLCMSLPSVLGLFSSGRTTGIVVEIGEGSTKIVPIFEGHGISYAIRSVDVSGFHLTEYLKKLLDDKGHNFSMCSRKMDVIKDIKHTTCQILSRENDQTIHPSSPSTSVSDSGEYELPDGTLIDIGEERYQCPEALFDPSLVEQSSPGIHKSLLDSIEKCDQYLHSKLFNNILLTGGSTLIAGITDRLQESVQELTLRSSEVKVATLRDRKYAAVIGGSLLASMPIFEQLMITKESYSEDSQIIHNKFL